MSGGVGPSGDISLPKEEVEEEEEEEEEEEGEEQSHLSHDDVVKTPKQGIDTKTKAKSTRLLSFRHLNCLAIMVVLAASGMVTLQDSALVLLSLLYFLFLSRAAFPRRAGEEGPVFGPAANRALGLYVLFAAVLGLLLPVLYIVEGVAEGDRDGVGAAAPHLFLLASQVFMEGVSASAWARFSLPVRAMVPVYYNSTRMYALLDWAREEMAKAAEGGGYAGSARRVLVGRVLALANLLLWSFNLFGFLLPVYLPRALSKYYTATTTAAVKKRV